MSTELPRLPIARWPQMRRELGVLTAGRGWQLAGVVVLMLISAATGLVLPLTIGWIVDTVAEHAGSGVPTVFWWQLVVLVGAALAGGTAELCGIIAFGRVAETMIAELRERFVAAALRLPEAEIEQVGTGDVVTRAAVDTRKIAEEMPGIVPRVVLTVFSIVLTIAGAALIDWRFVVAFLLAAPLYAAAVRWYLPVVPPVYAAGRDADSTRGERVLSTLNALPTVTAFGAGANRLTAIRAATWEVGRWNVRGRIMLNRLFGRINLAEAVGMLLVLGCGFVLAARYGTSLGQITAAVLLFLQLTGPIAGLLYVMDEVQAGAASFARVVGVIQPADHPAERRTTPTTESRPEPGPPTAPGPTAQPAGRGRRAPTGAVDRPLVRLEGVEFAYQAGHRVLHGVDLSLHAGEHVAIVGSTGSGKTTLARLIAGVRQPSGGRISLAVERAQIAYLDQESHVFAATLRENLALADPHAADDVLRRALVTASAGDLLATLPAGLDTPLGDEGHRLTGADAQLLSLARLALHDPAVAILDEATAEADSRNAALLDRATADVLAGRAAIVIAHRLAQARMCDRIIVLEHGEVVEAGTHDDLVAAGGRYAELWDVYSSPNANQGTDRPMG